MGVLKCHQLNWFPVSYRSSPGQGGSPGRAHPQDRDHAWAQPAQPLPSSYPSAAAGLPSLPFLLSYGTSTTLLARLQHVCHETEPKMQATATLLALTDPRGDKYVCLLLHEQSWW